MCAWLSRTRYVLIVSAVWYLLLGAIIPVRKTLFFF